MRGFEKVSYISNQELPKRATIKSAGYDLKICEDVEINPGEVVLVQTGIRAYMQDDEVLKIYIRSSVGFKRKICLANNVGIIDADYYDASNEGHIMIPLYNFGNEIQCFKSGDRIAQAIFEKFLLTCDDYTLETRSGGFGSTK